TWQFRLLQCRAIGGLARILSTGCLSPKGGSGLMLRRFCICVLLACFSVSIAPGQTSFGSIVGSITDSTGAIMPNVQLALTNLATNTKLTTVSNQAGIFAFLNVPPGEYKIEAEQAGFKHFVRQPVAVQVQQTYQVDIQLTVG